MPPLQLDQQYEYDAPISPPSSVDGTAIVDAIADFGGGMFQDASLLNWDINTREYDTNAMTETSVSSPSLALSPANSFINLIDASLDRQFGSLIELFRTLGEPNDPITLQLPFIYTLKDLLKDTCGPNSDLTTISSLRLYFPIDVPPVVGLQHLPHYMPALRELTLDGSEALNSIRDLGTQLTNLDVLHVSRCALNSLDGISAMEHLAELYADDNLLTDLMACSMLEHIKVISVKRNQLDAVNSVCSLFTCEKLEHLLLEDNPCSRECTNYRQAIRKMLPHIKVIDGIEVSQLLPTDNQCTLPAIVEKSTYASNSTDQSCSYTVSFSPKVLSPRVTSEADDSFTIKTKFCHRYKQAPYHSIIANKVPTKSSTKSAVKSL